MMTKTLKDRYCRLLKTYVARPQKKHLAAAAKLGSALVLAEVAVEEIAELHEEALRGLASTTPNINLPEAALLSVAPLKELLVAYGLTFREGLKKEKLTAQELKKCETHLAEMQTLAGLGSWEWNIAANELTWSDALYQIYGLDPSTFGASYNAYLERVHKEDRARASGVIQEALRNCQPFSFEERIVRPDGEIRVLSTAGKVVLDNNGRPVRMVGTCIDITGRKRTEEQLHFQKTLLECQSEAALDGILVVSNQREWLYFNRRFIEMWELPRRVVEARSSEVALRWVWDKLTDPERFMARIDYLYEHRDKESRDEILLKDGRTLECYSAPVKSLDGVYYGRVWYYRDISQRKQAEEALQKAHAELEKLVEERTADLKSINESLLQEIDERRQAEEALRASEDLAREQLSELDHLYNTAPVGLCLVDRHLRFVRINERLAAINGRPISEHIGKTLKKVIPEIAKEVEPIYRQVLRSGEPALNLEIHGVTPAKPGVPGDWLVSYYPLKSDNGKVQGVSTVVQDITERKRAEELVLNIARGVSAATGEQFLRSLVKHLADMFQADLVFIGELEHTYPKRIRTIAVYANGAEAADFAYNLAQTPCKNVVGRTLTSYPSGVRQRFPKAKLLADMDIEGYVGTPLFDSSGRELGLLGLLYREPINDLNLVESTLQIFGVRAAAELERKQTEEALQKNSEHLRALAAHLQSVREEERTAIARELHDELGQVLTALKIDLAVLGREINQDPDDINVAGLLAEINSMRELIDATINKVRTTITELRPEVLDSLGLLAALEWQSEEFEIRTGIKMKFRSAVKEIDFNKTSSTAVFRIFQEALTNIARHAQATRCKIRITQDGENLLIEISDNGIGIPKNKIESSKTFGLLGMKERALILGGVIKIVGAPGKGTTVQAWIPVKK